MNPLLKLLAIIAALGAAFIPAALSAQAVVGQPAPSFSLTDLDGQPHDLRQLRGKTVVLEWVNPDCPFVKKHYGSGNLPDLQKSATQDGVVWLLINSAPRGGQGDYDDRKVRAWMDEMEAAPTAYLRDPDLAVGRSYGAKTTPHLFVINPQGTLVYDGAIDSIRSANVKDIAKAENYVTVALAAVQRGSVPERSKTEPYGCTIKY